MMTPKTTINPIQLHLPEMFRYCNSEQMMAGLKDCLAEFYAKQLPYNLIMRRKVNP